MLFNFFFCESRKYKKHLQVAPRKKKKTSTTKFSFFLPFFFFFLLYPFFFLVFLFVVAGQYKNKKLGETVRLRGGEKKGLERAGGKEHPIIIILFFLHARFTNKVCRVFFSFFFFQSLCA